MKILTILFFLLSPLIYSQTATNDLLLELKFENNVFDSSSNGRDGTIYGTPNYVPGINGQALSFDGIDDYVRIFNSEDLILESFTLSAWVNWQGDPTAEGSWSILSNWYGGSTYQHYGLRMGTIAPGIPFNHAVIFYDDGSEWDWVYGYKEEISNEGWHHVVGVVEAGQYAEIYLDGYDVGRDETSIPNLINPTGDLCIAKNGLNSSLSVVENWNGFIDEVKIYNRALTDTEIEDIFTTMSTIVEKSNLNQVDIYPNPTDNILHCELSSFKSNKTLLKIFDISGSLVLQTELKNTYNTIEISKLKSGIYFVEIDKHRQKLIIK
jgi:hypothetical protein